MGAIELGKSTIAGIPAGKCQPQKTNDYEQKWNDGYTRFSNLPFGDDCDRGDKEGGRIEGR